MNPPPGVHSRTLRTSRLNMKLIESGPSDGIPVLMIHGNLSTGRFFEHLMPGAPDRYRIIAPDMRGFGDTEQVPIDGTRGLRDWADDTHSLVQALGITQPVHLVGWATGGAAIANYAADRPVAPLTLIAPVSPSPTWPGIAPGTRGILNALSPKYCNWADIVDLEPKPPILWTHGTADIVVADGSAWEMGTLGKMGVVPGWPGEEIFPPQPMVSQIRNVLERYRAAGGRVQMEMFEGSGHGPVVDAADRWSEIFFAFLASAEVKAVSSPA